MHFDKLKEFVSHLSLRDLPTGAAALAGIILLFLVFKAGKTFTKLLFVFIAVALFAGAYWWQTHR